MTIPRLQRHSGACVRCVSIDAGSAVGVLGSHGRAEFSKNDYRG